MYSSSICMYAIAVKSFLLYLEIVPVFTKQSISLDQKIFYH